VGRGKRRGGTILLKLLGKRNILCVDDPIAGFVGAALPAYRRLAQRGVPTFLFFNES